MVFALRKGIIFIVCIFIFNYIKIDGVQISHGEVINIFVILLSALISTIITNTVQIKFYQRKVKYVIQPFIYSFIISVSIYLLISIIFSFESQFFNIGILIITTSNSIEILYVLIRIQAHKETKAYREPGININLKDYQEKLELIKINPIINDLFEDEKFIDTINISEYLKTIRDNKKLLIYNNESLSSKMKNYELIVINDLLRRKKEINTLLNHIYPGLVNGGLLLIRFSKTSISKIELSGRLAFHGFDLKTEFKKDGDEFIVARKEKTPSNVKTPSTGTIIALDRVGLYGKKIKIHKLRSMYPYSEFIQNKILEEISLSEIGKLSNDPRITPLGKKIRKYWIDELPQIYDWLRGEIKLVGIRALSYPFFSLYPDRYQKKYLAVKPGFICPIFDERTSGLNDIIKIEEKYLDTYIKHPIKADVQLFFKTLFMMLRGTRST